MMRKPMASAMQKTYDECYLICSTAVYFEGQNNEAEALRSWRSALDQIYYHNAYRVPPNYVPKTETEKALHESLRGMELQCKERVDLLDALKKSRKDAAKKAREAGDLTSTSQDHSPVEPKSFSFNAADGLMPSNTLHSSKWLGDGTVPPIDPHDLPRQSPALPVRPSVIQQHSDQTSSLPPQIPTPTLPAQNRKVARTPSPDKKGGRVMLTTLRAPKDSKSKSGKSARSVSGRLPHASSKAAGLAWDAISRTSGSRPPSSAAMIGGDHAGDNRSNGQYSGNKTFHDAKKDEVLGGTALVQPRSQTPPEMINSFGTELGLSISGASHALESHATSSRSQAYASSEKRDFSDSHPPKPPAHGSTQEPKKTTRSRNPSPIHTSHSSSRTQHDVGPTSKPPVSYPSYRVEYPPTAPTSKATAEFKARTTRKEAAIPVDPSLLAKTSHKTSTESPKLHSIARRPITSNTSSRVPKLDKTSDSNDETTGSEIPGKKRRSPRKTKAGKQPGAANGTAKKNENGSDENTDGEEDGNLSTGGWSDRIKHIQKHLPKGVDENAAKQIFNEIVVKGDEVHWADVAGLEAAKTALKEAVVYPFLRPDLFMGLREPARGMLLFGPPGTGKTMLARAVATESRSTFFAISASSLTSKWLGESEKLVRALFLLAKALAPSIIFVDEIDSLLSSRGGNNEHESTRRIKTEFLIQWSDLQRAAAGKQQTAQEKAEGDATRVLVLAATNMPWAIDEAARRRFVRRQYIPLPEAPVRAEQLKTLLGYQKHSLNRQDIQVLVELTDGFSGSDITALAKDAAMGPLRSLGEALLYMSMDEIRPINFGDFEASLINIRPSVSKQGLQEFEDWAKEFGERGG